MNIKDVRLFVELSQAKAAELIGVPKRTWEDWEAERRHPPKYVEKLIVDKLLLYGLEAKREKETD